MDVDGSSNPQGAGAGIVLEGSRGILIEQSLRFNFKTSNNQAKYEAIIAGVNFSQDVSTKRLLCKIDSRLTVGHLNQVKDPMLSQYYHVVTSMIDHFDVFKIEHISRSNNTRTNLLSNLGSTKKKDRHQSLLQQTLTSPSIQRQDQCMQITIVGTWMKSFIQHLEKGTRE